MDQRTFYNRYVRPHLRTHDRPFNRALYADAIDALHRSGKITDKQAKNWCYPETNAFLHKENRHR